MNRGSDRINQNCLKPTGLLIRSLPLPVLTQRRRAQGARNLFPRDGRDNSGYQPPHQLLTV